MRAFYSIHLIQRSLFSRCLCPDYYLQVWSKSEIWTRPRLELTTLYPILACYSEFKSYSCLQEWDHGCQKWQNVIFPWEWIWRLYCMRQVDDWHDVSNSNDFGRINIFPKFHCQAKTQKGEMSSKLRGEHTLFTQLQLELLTTLTDWAVFHSVFSTFTNLSYKLYSLLRCRKTKVDNGIIGLVVHQQLIKKVLQNFEQPLKLPGLSCFQTCTNYMHLTSVHAVMLLEVLEKRRSVSHKKTCVQNSGSNTKIAFIVRPTVRLEVSL